MSRPYIPQGMPITVTIDGHWDGLHNGNEPYMTYPGHEGSPRAVHIPHGALVQTKPEEQEAVEFTVDKTPTAGGGRYRMSMDLDLRTGEWHHVDGEKCPEGCKYHERTPTDTGEPLDADHCEVCGDPTQPYCSIHDGQWIPDHVWDKVKAPSSLDALAVAALNNDTPRKPESGDRVRVTRTVSEEGYYVVSALSGTAHVNGKEITPDLEVTVIKPARPAVPDEPGLDTVVMAGNWPFKHLYPTDTGWQRPGSDMTYSWESVYNFSEEPPSVVERGPVVGA